MRSILRFLVRTSAFIRKEIVEILRQPRLLITLVLGPFLILLLFGIGYSANPIPVRTVFVIPEDSELRETIEAEGTQLIQQMVFEGITTNPEVAKGQLRAGEVDLIIMVPGEVEETIRANQQATFTVVHDEIDPVRSNYIQAFADIYVNEMNKRMLRTFTEESQEEAATLQPEIAEARESAASMRRAVEADDEAEAQQQLDELESDVSALEAALLVGGFVMSQQGAGSDANAGESEDPAALVEDMQSNVQELRDGNRSQSEASNNLAEIEQDLATLETTIQDFQSIDANVLISPFRSELETIMPVDITLVDFYTPGVIVLLLQHLSVTFGALSIVREHRLGTMELFRAAPLSAFEVLLGKTISYLFFTALLATVVIGLLFLTLGVPMLGDWGHLALIVGALLYTSLGLGFLISLLSKTTSQAVQYSMLALLISVFFTGFLLSLDLLIPSVRLVSWLVPGTYAIDLLQNVMLRGREVNLVWISILAGIGALLFLVDWLLLRRAMARI
ncbi:MAG TPA: ABC transporter permease [Anaerolineae bacterium]|nr:ABC transporter permease [Anaerolineae bacterium]